MGHKQSLNMLRQDGSGLLADAELSDLGQEHTRHHHSQP